jgi:DNA polymerase III subunit epsilon
MNARSEKPGYVAIDFETASESRDSACAIGVAVIENGRVAHSFHQRLIRPPTDYFSEWNFRTHGIHWKDIASEAESPDVWADMQNLIHPLVRHVEQSPSPR